MNGNHGPRAGSSVLRMLAALRSANAAVPAVPRWARMAAHAVPFTVLPSGLWRVAAVTCHAPLVGADDRPAARGSALGLPAGVYVVILTVLSEALAFLAVGLIARWGEEVPAWVPRLGGRRLPTNAVVVPAAAGAVVLTTLWTTVCVTSAAGVTIQGDPLPADNPLRASGWRLVVFLLAYLPLMLWGPLLGGLTVAYRRRRDDVTT
jgi:hypothetical protein